MSEPTGEWIATTPYACGWTTISCDDKLNDPANAELAQRSIDSAAEILWALSGRQFGLCETIVRPCREDCCDVCDGGWMPLLTRGVWTNVTCRRHCRGSCDCTQVCELWLPGPIDSLVSVWQNGVEVDLATLHIDRRHGTVLRSGDVCWPKCQDMLEDAHEPTPGATTLEITYLKGKPVPASLSNALGTLASEIAMACLKDDCCTIPRSSLRQISRQGVTEVFVDPMAMIETGRTGVYTVDLALVAFNPKGRVRSAAVLSPDMVSPRRFDAPLVEEP